MKTEILIKKWRRLDAIPFEEISKARNFAHEAIQFLANTAISFAQKREDDSHTNCEWSRNLKAFVGTVFGEKNKISLGLNISDFKLLLLKENWTIVDEFLLKDKNLENVLSWLKNNFEIQGLESNKFTLDKHYEITAKTVSDGGKFLVENEKAFHELSDYYSNADLVIRAYISDLTNAVFVRDITKIATVFPVKDIALMIWEENSNSDGRSQRFPEAVEICNGGSGNCCC